MAVKHILTVFRGGIIRIKCQNFGVQRAQSFGDFKKRLIDFISVCLARQKVFRQMHWPVILGSIGEFTFKKDWIHYYRVIAQ